MEHQQSKFSLKVIMVIGFSWLLALAMVYVVYLKIRYLML